MVRARGVSELAWASRSPVLHWAVGALHLPSRVSCTTDGGQTSWRGLSSTAGVAWASDGTAPDADGLGAHLARPGQEYLCRSRVDRAGRKQPHAARNRAPRGAYYCGRCAVCRQQAGRIGSDGRHHAEGTGTGTGVRPPSSLICWPDRSVPNSSTHLLKKKKKKKLKHARTHARHLLMLRLRGRLVHELQLPVALRARPECGWCMLMGYRRRPKFAGFGWRVVEQFHPFRRLCVSIRVFFFFPTTC